MPPVYPDAEPSYSGFEGFGRLRGQYEEIWDDFRVEAERVFDAGDQLVVFARVSGFEVFLGRREALQAVGLEDG